MQRYVLIAGLVLALPWLASAQAPDLGRMDIVLKSVPDGPVAKVQSRNIGREDFVRFYISELDRVMREQRTPSIPDETRAELAHYCLSTLVERELLYDEAVQRELTVTDESVSKAWEAQSARAREALGGDEAGDVAEEDIIERLGFESREVAFAHLERALMTEKMRSTVIRENDVAISDEEIARIYNEQRDVFRLPSQLRLKQIYIRTANHDSDTAARKVAENALARIYSGQTFSTVAQEVSDSPDAAKGGDLGMLPVEALPPFISEAALELEPGEISEVVKSRVGYHVVQLVERSSGTDISLEDARPMITRRLMAREGTRVIRAHCDRLIREGAAVKVFLEIDKNFALNRSAMRGDHE